MQKKRTKEDFIRTLGKFVIMLAIALATVTPLTATTASADDSKPPVAPVQQSGAQTNVSWNCCGG